MNTIVGKQNRLQGKAAEYRVASELLLRGLHTHFPSIEEGYDIMVGGGIRVQVKSTNLRSNSISPHGAYWFRFRKVSNYRANSASIKWKNHPREFSKECDFVVLVGVTQWKFWVVPAAELDDVQCVMLKPNTNMDQLVAEKSISDKSSAKFMSRKLVQYEDRWDLIIGCLGSLREADAALISSDNINKEALEINA